MKRSPLRRRTPLRSRSAKRIQTMKQRRRLVALMLRVHYNCQVCSTKPSVHVHELLTRARGGSILDADNCIAVCADCHRTIHDNPAWAASLGLLRHSWDRA